MKVIEMERAYRELVDHSPDAVVILTDGNIIYGNQQCIHLLGATDLTQISDINFLEFFKADSFIQMQSILEEINSGKVKKFTEVNLYQLDGNLIEVEVKGIPAISQNQKTALLFLRDIGERKKTEKLLGDSDKLLMAGQFAAGIAHEIRNPITAIKGFLQLMEHNSNTNDYYLNIIFSEVNRIELILSELLSLSKPKEMDFKHNNLQELLREVTALIETQAILHNIELQLQLDDHVPNILCDANKMKQVFINFLKNSIEAMPDGGTISVQLRKERDTVYIRFKDNGPGIPKKLLHRIHEPFFTTKEKGTGLGLMISKQIIENHQGYFTVNSNSFGTAVEICIPIIYPDKD